MHKFLIIVVSKDNQFCQLHTNHDAYGQNIKIMQIANNVRPLTSVYNDYIKLVRTSTEYSDYDFIVFLHADVSLDLDGLLKHIDSCADKYDAIGLCGCSKISVSQSPLNWYCGSIPYPEFRWGCVMHGEMKNQMSFFNAHTPDVTDHPVACIDGLCIIFGKKVIESDLLFDEQFLFDFYDTDFSFQCVMKYKFKLGVIVRKDLQHYSVGKSILTEDFLRHELDFRKKWNLDVPPNSKLQMFIDRQKTALA